MQINYTQINDDKITLKDVGSMAVFALYVGAFCFVIYWFINTAITVF